MSLWVGVLGPPTASGSPAHATIGSGASTALRWRFHGGMTCCVIDPAGAAIHQNPGRSRSLAGAGIMMAMTGKPAREQQETIAALLNAAKRKKQAVPLRREFVQQGAQRAPQPGPLR